MNGHCAYCNETTAWKEVDGWAFHTHTKHWRCVVCRVPTETKYWPRDALDQLRKRELSKVPSTRVRIQIRRSIIV